MDVLKSKHCQLKRELYGISEANTILRGTLRYKGEKILNDYFIDIFVSQGSLENIPWLLFIFCPRTSYHPRDISIEPNVSLNSP